jgi:hypothetical protein
MTDIITRGLNEKTKDEVQQRVNYILRYGIILSIFWLAGIGSLISIILGLKARSIMRLLRNTPKKLLKTGSDYAG